MADVAAPKFMPGPWVVEGRGPNMKVIFAGDPSTGNRLSPCFLADGDQEANARLIAAAPDLYEALSAILRHGELACVSAEPTPHTYTGGKKPASKDVWQFPRHMLTKLETALAKALGAV